jgi:hypothetical protein
MDVAEKLQQLAELHRRGELTDAEFAMAKQATLETPAHAAPGAAAPLSPFQPWPNNFKKNAPKEVSTWKRYRLTLAAIAGIIFLILAMVVFYMYVAVSQQIGTGLAQSSSGDLTGR